MIAMLLYGTTNLPDRLSALSPWVDSALSDADGVGAVPPSPSGRRLVKTHTPADGFPIWDGVYVVAVYRHPLDVFLSIRKHVMNAKLGDNPVLCGPIPAAVRYYAGIPFDIEDLDRDSLSGLCTHFQNTMSVADKRNVTMLHYASMIAAHEQTVSHLANVLDIAHDDALINDVTRATSMAAMRADPVRFVPEGGKGFWYDDTAFFDTGGTRKWQGILSDEDLAEFEMQMRAQVRDASARQWLLTGD